MAGWCSGLWSGALFGRELLNPSEGIQLGRGGAVIIESGQRPIQLERLNYLNDSEYKGKYDDNPMH